MVYEWVSGSRVNGDAQRIGERIDTIKEAHDGLVTPEQLVDDGRDTASPLHSCFEWNDTVAADKHRVEQARLVLRSITISISDDRRVPVRAFVCVEPPHSGEEERPESAYIAVHDALADENMRKQVLASALSEIMTWRRKYNRLQEFAQLFQVVDEFDLDDNHT
jgi:hypothetical protein